MAARNKTKFIFVTGGVLSGLGKGITAASIGKILKSRGFSVNIQKCDPYLNIDAGTLNPAEHGEVFVTADGAETDLDLGHYERFLGQELTQNSSLMSGRVLSQVISDERAGRYLGKTVQIIPHITEAMGEHILAAGAGFDFHIVEIGGTVGDYESLAFIEAIRELKYKVGAENVLYVHLVYLPFLEASGEIKTKPAQNSVRDLRALGIQPDILVARSDRTAHDNTVQKLSVFCGVEPAGIVLLPTVDNVYKVPLLLEDAGIGTYITQKLKLSAPPADLASWRTLTKLATKEYTSELKVGIVAKYLDHDDTYMSVIEALRAASWHNHARVRVIWIDAEKLADGGLTPLKQLDGILVPGGFGSRGVEGKILAATYALKHQLPYLGLCLGMQVAVIAFARQVLGPECNSTEFDPAVAHPVISLMADQAEVTDLGGTMRLGNYECVFEPKSSARKVYGVDRVFERHRHRYEFNNTYRERLESRGLRLSGQSPDGRLVELVEIEDYPFFMASQYHPEFKSRPELPHPLFDRFVAVMKKRTA